MTGVLIKNIVSTGTELAMNSSIVFLGVIIILITAFWFWKINDDFDYLQDKGRYKKDKDGEHGG